MNRRKHDRTMRYMDTWQDLGMFLVGWAFGILAAIVAGAASGWIAGVVCFFLAGFIGMGVGWLLGRLIGFVLAEIANSFDMDVDSERKD